MSSKYEGKMCSTCHQNYVMPSCEYCLEDKKRDNDGETAKKNDEFGEKAKEATEKMKEKKREEEANKAKKG